MGAPLSEGLIGGGEIHCPWHHARFSVTSGAATGAPAFSPLKCYETAVRDGRLFVTEPRFAAQPVSSAKAFRVVILGAGAAGYACADWLLRSDFGGTVTVVSDDPDPPYDRTVCSKQYLIGMKSRAESLLSDLTALGNPGRSVLRLGATAAAVDIAGKALLVKGDRPIEFDVLVLATGAEPKRATWPGGDLPNVHVLRSLRDADGLIRASEGATRVAVVGASFVGLEAAASLRQRKLEVHVIAPDEVPLKGLLGAEVGKMIRAVHEEKGVRFHLGRQVLGFDGSQLNLDDGSAVEADFVVLGIGVTPRIDIARAAGLTCAPVEEGGGLVVNERLETSHPGIFAIGDIARYPDPRSGKDIRIEHWVHAERQGQHVARTILGQTTRFVDVPFFWSAHFDTGLRYLGHVESIVSARTDGSIEGRNFTNLYRGSGGEEAFVSCNRDRDSLLAEAEWDGNAGSKGVP